LGGGCSLAGLGAQNELHIGRFEHWAGLNTER